MTERRKRIAGTDRTIYQVRRLPCNWVDVPFQERIKLERAGLAYPLSVYGYRMTLEPTPAGRKWLADNPEAKA